MYKYSISGNLARVRAGAAGRPIRSTAPAGDAGMTREYRPALAERGALYPYYCGMPGIFCGSPVICEVSCSSTFSSVIVVSAEVIFTKP
jgi:hypothetical protein